MHFLKKSEVSFIKYSDKSIDLLGEWNIKEDCAITWDKNAKISWSGEALEVYGVFVKHEWSAKIAVSVDSWIKDFFDLYSCFIFQTIIPLFSNETLKKIDLEVFPVAKNKLSKGEEMVFIGLLVKSPHKPGMTFEDFSSDSSAFKKIQVEMFDHWSESLKKSGEELETTINQRMDEYLFRLKEMLVYTNKGDKVLDIGCGFVNENAGRLIFEEQQLQYYMQDIDERVIEHNQNIYRMFSQDTQNVSIGENTSLPFEDHYFDLVFSSHCFEHSRDPEKTFAEVKRVLKKSGTVFFAVPFGWDFTKEHMFCLNPDEWVELCQSSGFSVQNFHIGKVYPQSGYDLVVVAKLSH